MIDDDYDFGFTAVDEEDFTPTSEIEDLKARLQHVENMILPFLNKLKENPDKPMIKWPNRIEVIDKQISKLLQYTRIT